MSEFTNHKETRVTQLVKLFEGILKGENPGELVVENQKLIESVIPSDVLILVDRLMMMDIPMDDLKRGINKLLNLLYKTISEYEKGEVIKNDDVFGKNEEWLNE